MLASFNRFLKGLTSYLMQWVRFFGRILVAIGLAISGQYKEPYRVVARTIETALRTTLIRMHVERVIDSNPLYVTFVVHMESAFSNKIDWSYFQLELMLLLGCGFHDVSHSYVGTSGRFSVYNIDITRTALANLELGHTEMEPDLFKERDTEYRLNRALELAKKTTLTPELLEKELGLTSFHANLLYSQVTKSEAIPKVPRGKLMN